MTDYHIESAPPDVIANVHRIGHEILVLVAKIMESPSKNAHYTGEIIDAAEELAEYFENMGVTGDGNEPTAIAIPMDQNRTFSDLFMNMAQLGVSGLFERMKEE